MESDVGNNQYPPGFHDGCKAEEARADRRQRERALKEAEERREAKEREAEQARAKEVDGPKGPDPVRYGDWEKDGIASDF